MTSIVVHTIRLLIWDTGKDIIFFPVWWYWQGLQIVWHASVTFLLRMQHRIGVQVWIKNWLQPMYAQFDWQGRLISFFFRTVVIVYKVILFFVVLLLTMICLIAYVCVLPVAVLLAIRAIYLNFFVIV